MPRLSALLLAVSCAIVASPASAQELAAAIDAALANSPPLDEAAAAEAAASATIRQARAESGPSLTLQGQIGAGRIDNGGFFGIAADDVIPLSVQALAEMPLFTGGRIESAVSQANAGREMARLGQEQARREVTLRTVGAYVEVLTARRLEHRFTRLVAALAETERQAGLRFETGEIPRSDYAQARARHAEGSAALAQAEGRRISAEAALARLTGSPAGTLAPLPSPPAVPGSLDAALDLARTGNPMLLQAEAATRGTEAGLRSARAAAMPSVGVYAEAAHVSDQFFPGYRADSVAVGVRGRWTLYSGDRNAAAIAAARADTDAAAARLRQARLMVDGAVVDAWVALNTAHRMAEASQLRADAAGEALRGRRLEAEVGAVPTLAVLDAEREAAEAEAALIEAQGMQVLAAWRIRALTGE